MLLLQSTVTDETAHARTRAALCPGARPTALCFCTRSPVNPPARSALNSKTEEQIEISVSTFGLRENMIKTT